MHFNAITPSQKTTWMLDISSMADFKPIYIAITALLVRGAIKQCEIVLSMAGRSCAGHAEGTSIDN